MIRNLTISGFRAFDRLEIHGLGRVNLLVGKNNCGKTCVLEAIQLLASQGNPGTIQSISARRGERIVRGIDDRKGSGEELAITHLFHLRRLGLGKEFRIEAADDSPVLWVAFTISELGDDAKPLEAGTGYAGGPVGLVVRGHSRGQPLVLHLTSSLQLPANLSYNLGSALEELLSIPSPANPTAFVVPTDSLAPKELGRLWQQVALTPAEAEIIACLRVVEPRLERLAYLGVELSMFPGQRDGFAVKLRDSDEPVPVGNLGDGVWRMLSLALACVSCRGGFLLVDEIDTGLHHSVLTDAWRFILEMSRRLNAQVFATSHSDDCVRSLAELCRASPEGLDHISIQRIESGRTQAVAFSQKEIAIASEHEIEVR